MHTYLRTPADTCMYSVFASAFRIRQRLGRRSAHGVALHSPSSASMAPEIPVRAPSCFWAGQWVGLFVQFKLKKPRPRTRPEPALPPLIPIGPLGLTGKVGGGHRPGM